MNQIVPPRFLFRWSFVARKIDSVSRSPARPVDLGDDYLLPSLSDLDQSADFAKVRLGWSQLGLAVAVSVSGRSGKPVCDLRDLDAADGVRIWIDTRNTQTIHRATKFCHHFVLLPSGAGAKRTDPVVRSLPVARAKEETELPNHELVKIESEITTTGYRLNAWFPADVFAGFDPATYPRIGFHYLVHDQQLGNQTLAVGNEFPYESDPSLWQTVELAP